MQEPILIGITGTRNGGSEYQLLKCAKILSEKFIPGSKFNHGDCVGIDQQVARIARKIGYVIVCHPPDKDEHRAFEPADIMLPAYSYFTRNRNIVNAVDLLLVCPVTNEWQPRGGTWYTHDFAKKVGRDLVLITPEPQEPGFQPR